MRERFLRGAPEPREDLAAALLSAALAAGVGLVTFYCARLLLSRDAIGTEDEREPMVRAPREEE